MQMILVTVQGEIGLKKLRINEGCFVYIALLYILTKNQSNLLLKQLFFHLHS